MSSPDPPAAYSSPASDSHRPHILTVTDDAALKIFLVEGLVPGGFWLSVVASAIQTLEVLRLRSFDLLLIDDQLAGLPALELIRRIRARPQSSEMAYRPVILLSERDDATLTGEERAAGIDGVLVPPVELEELIPALHRTVRTWRTRHPSAPWADEMAQTHEGGEPH